MKAQPMSNEPMSNVWRSENGKVRQLTLAEARADRERALRKEAERIAAGGCPHPMDEWEHEYDEDSILGDAYYCGRCGELMQVG